MYCSCHQAIQFPGLSVYLSVFVSLSLVIEELRDQWMLSSTIFPIFLISILLMSDQLGSSPFQICNGAC